jgi:squalene-hopene/tetraprenyl-beta-curcumene cyclase
VVTKSAAPKVVDGPSFPQEGGRWAVDGAEDGAEGIQEVAAATLARARDHLLGLQDPGGWWQGELETNVTMDAEDVLLRHFLGILTSELATESAGWIRSKQREDGTWANFYGGPADLSTTVEAYVALRLAGDTPDEPHMRKAADWITARGGLTATRVFTRIWLALSGLWSWDELPVIPPEIIYLPSWFPLNIYDWGCWARQTVVALAVVASFKPARPLPFTIGELYARPENGPALRRLDHRPPGGRRLLGRHPAAVGVLDHGAAPARLRP